MPCRQSGLRRALDSWLLETGTGNWQLATGDWSLCNWTGQSFRAPSPSRSRRLQPALAGPLRHPAPGILRGARGRGRALQRAAAARRGRGRRARRRARVRAGARHFARGRHVVDRHGRDDLQPRRRARRSAAVAGHRSRRRARLADRALRGRHVPRSGAAGWHRGRASPRRSRRSARSGRARSTPA